MLLSAVRRGLGNSQLPDDVIGRRAQFMLLEGVPLPLHGQSSSQVRILPESFITNTSAFGEALIRSLPQNYAFFLYAFGTCLLWGAFLESLPDYEFGNVSVQWLDECDQAGQDSTAWTGGLSPGSAFPNQWKRRIFRRDFENAIVLINLRGI
jgi:hypothetical protein